MHLNGATLTTAILVFVVMFLLGGIVSAMGGKSNLARLTTGLSLCGLASDDWHAKNTRKMRRSLWTQRVWSWGGAIVGTVGAVVIIYTGWSFPVFR